MKYRPHVGLASFICCTFDGGEEICLLFARRIGRPPRAALLDPVMKELSRFSISREQPLDDPDVSYLDACHFGRSGQSSKQTELCFCQCTHSCADTRLVGYFPRGLESSTKRWCWLPTFLQRVLNERYEIPSQLGCPSGNNSSSTHYHVKTIHVHQPSGIEVLPNKVVQISSPSQLGKSHLHKMAHRAHTDITESNTVFFDELRRIVEQCEKLHVTFQVTGPTPFHIN